MATETRRLECKLTKTEQLDRSKRLAWVLSEAERLEDERQDANKLAKQKISELESETKVLRRAVQSGTEVRDVECEVERDEQRHQVNVRRLDTKQIVEERPMQPHERQEELPNMEDEDQPYGAEAVDPPPEPEPEPAAEAPSSEPPPDSEDDLGF